MVGTASLLTGGAAVGSFSPSVPQQADQPQQARDDRERAGGDASRRPPARLLITLPRVTAPAVDRTICPGPILLGRRAVIAGPVVRHPGTDALRRDGCGR